MNDKGKLNSRISARVLFGQLSSPLEERFDAINSQFNEHIIQVEKTANILELERKLLKESSEAWDKAGKTGWIYLNSSTCLLLTAVGLYLLFSSLS